jgi:energy-coupling factor transporter ATP-binding protein EcfA2
MVELAREGIPMICMTHKIGVAWHVADWVIFMDAGASGPNPSPPPNTRGPSFSSAKYYDRVSEQPSLIGRLFNVMLACGPWLPARRECWRT